MAERITWKWITESFFPLLVADARRAGVDTTGWALDSREGPGRCLVRLNPDKSVATVYQRFATPRDADLIMRGMRFAWSRTELSDAPVYTLDEVRDAAHDPAIRFRAIRPVG